MSYILLLLFIIGSLGGASGVSAQEGEVKSMSSQVQEEVPVSSENSQSDLPSSSASEGKSSVSVIEEMPISEPVEEKPSSSSRPISSAIIRSSSSQQVSSRSSASALSAQNSSVASSPSLISSRTTFSVGSVSSSSESSSFSSESSAGVRAEQTGSGWLATLFIRENFGYSSPVINPTSIVRPGQFSLEPGAIAGNAFWSLVFALVMGVSGVLLHFLKRTYGKTFHEVITRLPKQLAFTLFLTWIFTIITPVVNAQGTGAPRGVSLLSIPIFAFTLFIVVGLSNTLFNNILVAEGERMNAFLVRLRPDTQLQRNTWFILILTLLYGIIGGYINPEFSILPSKEVGIILVTVFTIIVSTYAKDSIAFSLSKKLRYESWFQGHLAGLIIAIGCVVLTRNFDLDPGYIYGVPAGLIIGMQLSRKQEGLFETIGMVCVLVLTLIAWIVGSAMTDYPVLLDIVNLLFVILIEEAFLEMMPLPTLPGEVLYHWKKLVWFTLFVLVTFFMFHTLFNPEGTVTNLEQHPPAAVAVTLLACYAVGVFLLWGFLAWKRARTS